MWCRARVCRLLLGRLLLLLVVGACLFFILPAVAQKDSVGRTQIKLTGTLMHSKNLCPALEWSKKRLSCLRVWHVIGSTFDVNNYQAERQKHNAE
uniref:Uncharacterized protein n=1 Tax=Oryza brachyantha TaxID=4533 RepID=J3MFA8_ORYBR